MNNTTNPHELESRQSSIINFCDKTKAAVNEILRYAGDFDKKNFLMKKASASKIKGKIQVHIGSIEHCIGLF